MAHSRELEGIASELMMKSDGFIATSFVALILIGLGAGGVFTLSETGALDRTHLGVKTESAAIPVRHSIHLSRISHKAS
jgi:hypothetical protein